MTTRYITIRQLRKNLSRDVTNLLSLLNNVNGIDKVELIGTCRDGELRDFAELKLFGEDYNFIDVLNTINRNGYSILEDKIVK